MVDMPTAAQLTRVFGVGGAMAGTGEENRQLAAKEKQGRLVRGAQTQTNSTFQYKAIATFEDGGSSLTTDWISFGPLRFIKEPTFTSGSKRLAQDGEPTLNEDASNFDPTVHFTVPGIGQVLCWRQDDKGFYTGAKLLLWALASVPDGYKTCIYGVFTGPAIRVG